jgi:hypothetical protein
VSGQAFKKGTPITVLDPNDPIRNWNAIFVSGPHMWGDCLVVVDRGNHPIKLHRDVPFDRVRLRTILDKIVDALE